MSDYETNRDAAAHKCMTEYNKRLDEVGNMNIFEPVFSGFCNGADWARDDYHKLADEYLALDAKLEIAKAALSAARSDIGWAFTQDRSTAFHNCLKKSMERMDEALAQLEDKKCICGETNARNCPVHQ